MLNKEKRKAVLKKDERWLQNWTNRLLAYLFVRFLEKTRIQPNHLTLLSFILAVLSVFLIIPDTQTLRIIASICLFCSLVFDSADGQLARLKNKTSKLGYWLDKITDRLKESLLIIAITYVVYNRSLEYKLWYLGVGVIFLINFMYYNLELLKKIFAFRRIEFPRDNLLLKNILSFGYGERIIYLSLLILFNQLIFALCLIETGCMFHILANSYMAIQKREG